jgi:hypothetical protein
MSDDYGISTKKAIVSGSIVEVTEFSNGLLYGFRRPKKRHFRDPSLPSKASLRRNAREVYGDPLENEKLALREMRSLRHRTKSRLIRLCASNAYHYLDVNGRAYRPALITFTFRDDVRDLDTAHRFFQLFIKRFNYDYNQGKHTTLKYLAVPEFQDKTRQGVIHYHVLFFNMRFVQFRIIEGLWSYGSTNTKKAYRMKSIGNYLTKYLVKNFDDTRMDGRKRFFCSKGLAKPRVFYAHQRVDVIKAQCLGSPCRIRQYQSIHLGDVTAIEYSLTQAQARTLDVDLVLPPLLPGEYLPTSSKSIPWL